MRFKGLLRYFSFRLSKNITSINSELIYFFFQDIDSSFGNGEIIKLGDMDMTVPHLRAKKMLGGIQFCHSSAIGMSKIMIFEVNSERCFYGLGVELHRVDSLNLPIRQTVYKFCAGKSASVKVGYDGLILFPNSRQILDVFLALGC